LNPRVVTWRPQSGSPAAAAKIRSSPVSRRPAVATTSACRSRCARRMSRVASVGSIERSLRAVLGSHSHHPPVEADEGLHAVDADGAVCLATAYLEHEGENFRYHGPQRPIR
jgi:hypothetical protein